MKFLVAGYYGFGNLGDELVLSVILRELARRGPDVECTVLSHRPTWTKNHFRCSAVSRWNPLAVAGALFRCDRVIVGGGGLLQDKTSARSVFYYLAIIGFARLCRKPIVLLAVGADALRGNCSRRAVSWMLNSRSITLMVRDRESKKILEESGVRVPIVETADPVFLLDFPKSSGSGSSALIIVRSLSSEAQEFYRNLHEALGRKKINWSWTFFQPDAEKHFLNGCSFLPPEKYVDITTSLNVDLSRFSLIVSARFHGLVIGMLSNVKILGFGDPDKVGGLCRNIDAPFLSLSSSPEEIEQGIEQAMARKMNSGLIDEQRRRAKLSFDSI